MTKDAKKLIYFKHLGLNMIRTVKSGILSVLLSFFCLLGYTTSVVASPNRPVAETKYSLTTGFISHHAKGEYNENNYGIGLEIRSPDAQWNVGYFRNSLDRDSFYVARGFRLLNLGSSLTAGVVVGATTGYHLAVTPIVLPFVEWRMTDHLAVNFLAIPPIPNVTPFTAAIQLKWSF